MAKQSLDELIAQSEEAIEKGEDLSEVEAEHHHKEKQDNNTKSEKIEEEIKAKKFGKQEKQELRSKNNGAEDQNTEKSENDKINKKNIDSGKSNEEKKAPKKKEKQGKAKVRSAKYNQAKALVDLEKKYSLTDAIDLAKKVSYSKFSGNLEIHVRLLSKTGKPEQFRSLINYPHSTGKKIIVEIIDEKLITEILETQKTPADIYLATPAQMPQVAKLAKILGPKGKMPNPKSGTVTNDPEKTKTDLQGGQIEYKTDSTGNIHQVIGKLSEESEKLVENAKTLLAALPKEKISSISICPTMGPGIKISK